MTIGIYSLYWEKQDLVYIGQSQNIERRFKDHIRNMVNNTHSNYKVQNAYNYYNMPTLVILEECSTVEQLNILEVYWQNEFNSLNSLDILKAGTATGSGEYASGSKYSKIEILLVFRALYQEKYLSHKDISNKFNVDVGTVASISKMSNHIWLKIRYPKLFNKVKLLQNSRISISPKHNKFNGYLVSPSAEIIAVYNISEFARNNKLEATHIASIFRKTRKSHKGWRLYNENTGTGPYRITK